MWGFGVNPASDAVLRFADETKLPGARIRNDKNFSGRQALQSVISGSMLIKLGIAN